jgi:hypothetical protein
LLFSYVWFSSGGKPGLLAEDIVRQGLKDPGSADFHSTKVVWSKSDLALVESDVSAKNGFGGIVRSHFCVCINSKTSQGIVLDSETGCGVSEREPASTGISQICESSFK